MRVIPMTRIRDSKNFVRFEEQDSQLIAGRSLYVDKAFTNAEGETSQVVVVVGPKAEIEQLIRSAVVTPPAPTPDAPPVTPPKTKKAR